MPLKATAPACCAVIEISTNKPPAGSRFVGVSSNSILGWTKDLHREQGNLCFADGSVLGFANGSIHLTTRLPAGVTNRLAVP